MRFLNGGGDVTVGGEGALPPFLTEPALQPHLKNMYTYMSISGPHLGYWYSSNSLFNSGLWLLKKLKGAQCIHQLTFSDDQDPQNTYFYKLCKVRSPHLE